MSKADNLKDFLVDLANAIREKKGTTGKINPQDFSSEIMSIETGSGAVESKEYKDVNFFDYEGTILYSYTWDEAKVMTELPPLPDRTSEGLVCQGWNYTLEDMMAQADENGENGYADIGAIYTTDDGSTRIHIELTDDDDLGFEFYIIGRHSMPFTVDWGDGTIENMRTPSTSARSNMSLIHQYASKGVFIIRVINTVATEMSIGSMSTALTPNIHRTKIIGINNGGISVIEYRLQYFINLKFFTYQNEQKNHSNLGQYAPYTKIKHISIPKSMILQYTGAYDNSFHLTTISLPNKTSELHTFMSNTNIEVIKIPKGAKFATNFSFGGSVYLRTIRGSLPRVWLNGMFSNCRNLVLGSYKGGEDTTTLPSSCFAYNQMMQNIRIPAGVTTIQQQAFTGCTSMRWYDFTDLAAVPTLQVTNAFTNIPTDCKIVVPDALVDEWKTATNWATYATYIIGQTEYLENGGIL